jgi:hypothetical protein
LIKNGVNQNKEGEIMKMDSNYFDKKLEETEAFRKQHEQLKKKVSVNKDKTAKEMFEKLEYTITKDNEEYLIYSRELTLVDYSISFSLEQKQVGCMQHHIGGGTTRKFTNVNEHLAIHQQMKELG